MAPGRPAAPTVLGLGCMEQALQQLEPVLLGLPKRLQEAAAAAALLAGGSSRRHVPELRWAHSRSRTDSDGHLGLSSAGSSKSQLQKHSCALSSDGGLCSLGWNWVVVQEKASLPWYFLTSVGVSTGIRGKKTEPSGTASGRAISHQGQWGPQPAGSRWAWSQAGCH